jgi:hypothetical protein
VSSTIHAWIRTEGEGFKHLTFLDSTIVDVAENLRGNNVIAIIDESLMVECEFTYEQPSNPYNKTIWWWRPKVEVKPDLDVDLSFLAELDGFDTLGEE